MSLSRLIEAHWYAPRPLLTLLLAPLSALFVLVSSARRCAYRHGWLRCERLPVPVVVVGNINVGGVGKTPLTRYLVEALRAQGRRPGVISRGYGGSHQAPTAVMADSPASVVGDEPLLLATAGCPVWVGRDRVAAGRALLAAHPDVDVLLSDDGLQHYRLARDVEIAVLDAARGLGNGWRLPAGPLREAPGRLATVDAVVSHGAARPDLLPAGVPGFVMTLHPGRFWQLVAPDRQCEAADLAGKDCAAVAGIGHPERFFATLASLGLHPRQYAFPDHHRYVDGDMPDADTILVTEKDAVKLRQGKDARIWALPVAAVMEPDLGRWLARTLEGL